MKSILNIASIFNNNSKGDCLNCIAVIFVMFMFIPSTFKIYAQTTSISIKASAQVYDYSEIELINMADIQIDVSSAVNDIISIPAMTDGRAGMKMVKGRPKANARLSFNRELVLTNQYGSGKIFFYFEIIGNPENNQSAGKPLTISDQNIQINSKGYYYLWIGGRIDISKAHPGNYSGEFTFEIEYI